MDRRIFAVLLVSPFALIANPSGPTVVYGEAGFETAGAHLKVTVSEKAIIEWNHFSIGFGETTQFIQPNAQSAVLNRVVSPDPSELFGTLQSNGQVYLINQNGVIVGSSGCMQMGSFIASTFDVLNHDFIAGGDLVFQQGSQAHLINEGKIAALEGDVVLVGQFVENRGEISASKGLCAIGCGETVLLKESGEERLFILAPLQTQLDREAGIQQKGLIEGLSAELKASGNPYVLAVLHEGRIDALEVKREGGKVFLVAEKGNLHVSGSIRAPKGDVHIHADQVVLADGSLIDVSSEWGGGSVHIGNDLAIPSQPRAIFTAPRSQIEANSLGIGNGGRVILWAEEMNLADGSIFARGGPLGGDGGFVEISSPKGMFPRGKVETGASFGRTGTLLLDPCHVTIDNVMTTVGVTPPGALGACPVAPTSYDFTGLMDATIMTSDLISYLVCNNVTIDATISGTRALGMGMITVLDTSADISWTAMGGGNPDPTTLTLRADNRIAIHRSIQAQSATASMIDVITLEAPNIDITSTSVALGVTTDSGNIYINAAPNAFFPNPVVTMASSSGAVLVATDSMTGGNVVIDTGDLSLVVTAGGCAIEANHDITINATGNIDLIAGSTIADIHSAGTGVGTHDVSITSTGGHLHLNGGTGALSFARVSSEIGSVTLDIDQEIQLLGGSGGFSPAFISSAFTSGVGENLTISNAGDIILTGGLGSFSVAMLSVGNPVAPPGGDGIIDITCNGTAMTLTAGSGMNASAGILTSGAGAANDISILFTNPASVFSAVSSTAGPVAGISTSIGGSITITGVGDLSLTGDTGGLSRIEVGAAGGNLNISGTGSAALNNQAHILNNFPMGTLTVNMGSVAVNAISSAGYIQSNGALSISASAGSIFLQTTAMGTQAHLQSQGTLTLNASGGIDVVSGLGDAFVYSVGADASLIAGGNIQVVATSAQAYILADTTLTLAAGGDLVITSGLSNAYVYSQGAMNSAMITGDILITANDTPAYLRSDAAAPMIQVGGNVEIQGVGAQGSIQAAGNLSIDAMGSVFVHGDMNAAAIYSQGVGASVSVSAGADIDLLTSVQGPSYITNFFGPTTITAGGALSIISSPNVGGAAGTAGIGAGLMMPGNLIVTAAEISLQANLAPAFITTGAPAFFMIGTGSDGTIALTATGPGGIALHGGSGMDAPAEISTNGSAATNDISIFLTDASADLTLSSTSASTGSGAEIKTVSGGSISINSAMGVSGRDLTMSSTTAASRSLISVGAAGGNILAFMGRSIGVGGFSRIENLNPAGTITLVADNDFKMSPAVGSGLFTLGSDAVLSTVSGSNLFIYTSTNTNPETINGMMNGSPIGMIVINVNTPTAQWGMWYPDNPNMVTGMPFTVFYKIGAAVPTPVVPVIPSFLGNIQIDEQFAIVNGEAFQLWKTYFDRGIYVAKKIYLNYDRVDEMRLLVGENGLSSFDLPEWFYLYFYQSHRNYNTLKLDPRM